MGLIGGIAVALLTSMVACAGAVAVAVKCVDWYRVSSFEGEAGYFVVFIGLAAAVVGLITGIVASARIGAGTTAGFFRALGFSSGSVVGLAAAALLATWLVADIPPTLDGRPVNLYVEFRMPEGDPDPSTYLADTSYITFDSVNSITHVQRASQRGVLSLASARREGERWILPGSVSIFTRRGLRTTTIALNDHVRGGFVLPIPSSPGHEFDRWSEWLPEQAAGGKPWPATQMSYRFRVQPAP